MKNIEKQTLSKFFIFSEIFSQNFYIMLIRRKLLKDSKSAS